VFLMVSGNLNRRTDEIIKVRHALGNRFAGVFDRMLPHTPRKAVIEAAAAVHEARADLIATVGSGRRQAVQALSGCGSHCAATFRG